MTFTHYHDVWASEMEVFGYHDFRQKMPYQKFTQTWYSFLELLKKDYQDSMCCTLCGHAPNLVICDGTSLGFQRKFLTTSNNTKESDIIPRYRLCIIVYLSIL